MTAQEHINQKNLLSIIPNEVLVLFNNNLTTKEKQAMLNFWKEHVVNPILDENNYSIGQRTVLGISRAEIYPTIGINNLGAELALFQGNIRDFFILTNLQTGNQNPDVYNYRALHALLFSGEIQDALEWTQNILEIYKNNTSLANTTAFQKTLLFTYILQSYAFHLTLEHRQANQIADQINILAAKLGQTSGTIFFWNWYFKAEIEVAKYGWDKALKDIEEAMQIAQSHNHRIYQGLAYQTKGRILQGRSEHILAYQNFRRAKELFEATNSIFLGQIYSNLGDLEKIVGRYRNARANYQNTIIEALSINKIPFFHLLGLKGLADLYIIQGNYHLAQDAYQRAMQTAIKTKAVIIEAACLSALGCIFSDLKNYKQAEEMLINSLYIREAHGLQKTYTLFELGQVFLKNNQISQAKTQFQIVRRLKREIANVTIELSLFKANLLIEEGKLNEGRQLVEKQQFSILGKGADIDLKIRIQLILARISTQEDIIDNDEYLEEVIDRLDAIRGATNKPTFPSMFVLFLLLDSFINYVETGNIKKSMNLILKANRLARQSNLIKIQNQIEQYKRRFSRIRISINQTHFRHIIQEMERSAYYLSSKILK